MARRPTVRPLTVRFVLLDAGDAGAAGHRPTGTVDVVVRTADTATGEAGELLVPVGAPTGVLVQRGLDGARGEVVVLLHAGHLPTGHLPAGRVPGRTPLPDVAARVAAAFDDDPRLALVVPEPGMCAVRLAAVPSGGVDVSATSWPQVVADLTDRLRSTGWTAGVEVADQQPPQGDHLLLVHPRVPRDVTGTGDRWAWEVLSALVTLWPQVPVTLLAAESAAPAAVQPLRAAGVEVVDGPLDWSTWLAEPARRYSTVLLSGVRMEHRFAALLDAHQPQAARVLLSPALSFRSVAGLEPALSRRDEVRGLHGLAGLVRERVAVSLERVDAVWCASEQDRRYVTGLFPARSCTVLPDPSLADGAEPPGLAGRRGLVVLGGPGSESFAAHEDAAVTAAVAVLPVLRAHDPALTLTVLSDRPSPQVARLAEQPGVHLAAWAQGGPAALAGARVALAPYGYGNGAATAIGVATAAGTPFVALSATCTAVDLGEQRPLFVTESLPGLVQRARQLLTDDDAWQVAAAALLERRARGGRPAFRRALVHALADLGTAPPAGSDLLPASRLRLPEPWAPTPPPPMVPLAKARLQRRPDPGIVVRGWPGPVTADEQYAGWLAASTPGPARLADLAVAVAGLVDPPVISIVVPTYDSDPEVLGDTLESVAAQTYPHWELCLADDASPSEATREVLRRWAARDPRVRVDLREANGGIALASNAALALATGTFVAFLDHDDLLKPHALAEVALALAAQPGLDLLYSDEDKLDEHGNLVEPFFKPDWSPEHLTSRNYVGHLMVLRRSLVEQVGGFRQGYDGSQDHDLLLRVTELTDRVAHLPEPLYTWRRVPGSTAAVVDAKPYAFDAAKRALDDALVRRGLPGRATDGLLPSTYRTRYDVVGRPKVAVIIPTRNGVDLLRRCIDSVRERSTYRDLELIVIDNQSDDPETLEYLATFGGRIVSYPHRFNYARMMNLASWTADADQLLFLNNDTEVIEPSWVEALLEHAQRPEVGAVGCRLYYPNDAPQHEGVIVNYAGGAAGNVNFEGWWGFGDVVRDCTAVTGAVTMMRPAVFFEVGGFEERLRVAFNDVDLCLRVRQAGYRVVYTPYATLYHHESATRGFVPHPEDDAFFDRRWEPRSERFHDPFYNPNLDRSYPFKIYS